jgi:aspartyl-tRNA synthetase
MHAYRTHTCGALRAADAGHPARLSGWVHAKRDHGGLLFIDLRDHYGIAQCVFPAGSPAFAAADAVRPASVITVTGEVVEREPGTVNPRLPTGEIELRVSELVVQSAAEVLPMQVAGDERFPEDIRLKYRFIDLRREKLHRNIMLRAGVFDKSKQQRAPSIIPFRRMPPCRKTPITLGPVPSAGGTWPIKQTWATWTVYRHSA